jgi:hypothetical protein
MAMIHVSRSGATIGVFDEERVREGLRTGEFIGTDLGWTEGMATWQPLSELESFRTPAAPPVTPAPPATATSPTSGTPGPVTAATIPTVRTEPLAIWSLVLSIVGFVCCGFLASIPAVICGHIALSRIAQQPQLQGRGMAIAGLVIGYLAIVGWLIWVVFFGGPGILQGIFNN